MRNAALARFDRLLAGHYSLPDDITAARRVAARVSEAATARTPPDTEARRAAFAQAILDSSGTDWPDPAQLLDLDAEKRAHEAWQGAVRDARDVAERSLYEVLAADPDRLITEHLRPAHAEAVAFAKANVAVAPLADGDPAVRAALTGGQRSRVDALVAAAARYTAVRQAWSLLTAPERQAGNDTDNVFAELRDLPDVWPTYRQRGQDHPWPTAPVARLCWVAVHATPWIPTAEQQEARWVEVFGTELEQAGRNRFALRGFQSIGGGRFA